MTDSPAEPTAYDMRPSDKTETRSFTLPLNQSGGSYIDDVWFAWTATYIDRAKPDEMTTVSNVASYRPDAKILNLSADDLPAGISVDDLVAMEQWRNHVASTPDTPDDAVLAVTTAIRLDDFHIIPKGMPVKHFAPNGEVTEYMDGPEYPEPSETTATSTEVE